MLKDWFPGYSLNMLYENFPSVFLEDEDELVRRLTFFFHVMHVSPEDVAESAALDHDLDDFVKPR